MSGYRPMRGMDTEVTDGGQGCDPACTSGVCDPASNTCVACLTHAQCGGDTPACDTSTKTCVACVADEQCGLGVCNPANNTCVGCLASSDCSGDSPVCDTFAKACVTCLSGEGCGNGELCDTANDRCVQCLGDSDCGQGVCDTALGTCVACLDNTDCGAQVCKTGATSDLNACVDCVDNSTCTDAAASTCNASNACQACSDVGDCSHIAGRTAYCEAGVCLGCKLESEADDCTVNNVSTFCDGATNTCSNVVAGNAGTCATCTANTDCAAGFRCVPTNYMGAPAGNYCMQLYTGVTCPNPYGGIVSTRDDISGNSVEVCMISENVTSCGAYNQYSDLCNGDDALCTATGGVCKQFGPGTRRCTYACIGDSDCDGGVTCNPIAGGKFCGATGN